MNKQTVIALKNPVNVLFYLQVLISEKYKFIYSELFPLLNFQSRILHDKNYKN